MSPARTRFATVLAVGLGAVAFFVCSDLFAQTVVRETDGTVSLRASGVPLGRLLQAIADVTPFEKLTIDAAVEGVPVTLAFEGVSVRSALIGVLEAAGVAYIVVGRDDGQKMRVLILAGSEFPSVAEPDGTRAQSSGERERIADEPRRESEAQRTEREQEQAAVMSSLTQILTTPPIPVRPGGLVELPFPGPDGTSSLIVPVPFGERSSALPFEVLGGTPSNRAPAPAPAPPVAAPAPDPDLRSVYDALLPPVAPQR